MRKVKVNCISILMVLALFACSPQNGGLARNPVAETIAAMDMEATLIAHELIETQLAGLTNACPNEIETPYGLIRPDCSVTVAERLIYDTEQIKVTIKSLYFDTSSAPALLFWVENNTYGGLNLRAVDLQINGFMMKGAFNARIPAQSQGLVALWVASDALAAAGVETIQYFEFNLAIDESQNWSQSITTERIRINTNAAPGGVLALNRRDIQLLDREGIRVYLNRYENPTHYTGAQFLIMVENNTDIDIELTALDLKINDHECESSYETQVLAGLKSVEELSLPENQLAINNIGRVDKLVFRLQVMRKDTGALIFNTDLIELVFEQP